VLGRMTLQTTEEHNIEKRKISLKEIARWQVNGKGQSEELLSYNLLTDIGVNMDQVSSVGGLHHSIFYSTAKDIMNRPFFLAFVSINNDEDEDGDAKYN
jgi:hypothetical protein